METRVAVVTGAGRGIGRAIALRLAHDGFAVAIADLDEATAQSTAAELAQGHAEQAFALRVDVTDASSVKQMIETVLARAGHIDVLVNNAGIVGPVAPVVSYAEDDWRHVLATNLDSVFLCCRAVLPHLLARGAGRIVNIASISGKEGNANMAAYSTSKAGVIGFTKALAKEVIKQGIYVNCVTPGLIDTDMARQVGQDTAASLVARMPMGRLGRAEEVAALVAWLASEECTFSTGAVFDISGGRATY
jgi:2-dehydro-3-deoxy-L-rhamnonate dehydrogenase (NAD+)